VATASIDGSTADYAANTVYYGTWNDGNDDYNRAGCGRECPKSE